MNLNNKEALLDTPVEGTEIAAKNGVETEDTGEVFSSEFEEEVVVGSELVVFGFPSFGGVPEGWGGIAPIVVEILCCRCSAAKIGNGKREIAPKKT